MAELFVLVDFDNIERTLTLSGAVQLSKSIVSSLPRAVLLAHTHATIRFYGGWRTNGLATNQSHTISADIQANAPAYIALTGGQTFRLDIELALASLGSLKIFSETYVRDRELRGFRARPTPLSNCIDSVSCGMVVHRGVRHTTQCGTSGCSVKLGQVFSRDEQKMVDTLIVADLADIALGRRATHLVLVSSDTDMWPGVLLAVNAGCNVLHIHSKNGWRTQRHLLNSMNASASHFYQQSAL